VATIPRNRSIAKPKRPLRKSHEYRVLYRRQTWSLETKDKVHVYKRRNALLNFLRRLRAQDRPDLSPLAFVKIEQREILAAPWTELRTGGAK